MPMGTPATESLTRCEREIMNALFALANRASAEEIRARLTHPPSSSAVRTMLSRLEAKGLVRHEEEGLRYVYTPLVSRNAARKSALRHVVDTFFDGSTEKAVAALLGGEAARLNDEELRRIADLIGKARKDGQR